MLVVNPAYKDVTEDWFDPAHWGARAQPVSAGGRGSAWFVETEQGDMVLRHYRRGGLVAKIADSSYVFRGKSRVRSFAEFRLLWRLYDKGFPVPRPVAAWYERGPFLQYRAAILVELIPGSQPLGDLVPELDRNDWHRLGRLIRSFHDAGVRHADLNCFNILLSDDGFYLIDFDKGQILSPGHAWKQGNLDRLLRSLRKVTNDNGLEQPWKWFTEGYQCKNEERNA